MTLTRGAVYLRVMAAKTAASPKPIVAKIEASEQPLQKIFSSDFDFSIPLYQRPYAWTTKETGELLSDLLDNMGPLNAEVDDTNPYFLGSLVLVKGDTPEADVVDGQQRLTTLTILLSALRTLLAQDEADGITELLYEKANPIKGTQNRYRLTLRTQDAIIFPGLHPARRWNRQTQDFEQCPPPGFPSKHQG